MMTINDSTKWLKKDGTPRARAPFPLRIAYRGYILKEGNLGGIRKNECYCVVDSTVLVAHSFFTLAKRVDRHLSEAEDNQ